MKQMETLTRLLQLIQKNKLNNFITIIFEITLDVF